MEQKVVTWLFCTVDSNRRKRESRRKLPKIKELIIMFLIKVAGKITEVDWAPL